MQIIINNCKLLLAFSLLSFFLQSCQTDRSEKEYHQTYTVCEGMFVEEYFDFKGGVFGGEITSEYLTDSSNFIVYIGRLDRDNERYRFYCYSQTISVVLVIKSKQYPFPYETKDSTVFDLDSLKRLNNFKRVDE